MKAWPVILGSAVAGFLAQQAGLPAAWLIGPMLVALGLSLTNRGYLRLPAFAPAGAQALIGVALSASADPESLRILLQYWAPVVLLAIAVLVISIGSGIVLSRMAGLDPVTALFGTLPGGSAGMVAMADELGGDVRMVAFMQYTRLILVVLSASLLARFVLAPSHVPQLGGDITGAALVEHPLSHYVLTIMIAIVGGLGGVRLGVPAGALAGPVLLGVAVGAAGLFRMVLPPGLLLIAYAVIGIRAGSRFDIEAIRRLRHVVAPVLGYVVLLLVGCGLLGWGLAAVAEIEPLTAYLATTPGGIDSVTAAAIDTGADTTLVLAVQLFRMLAVVIVGPLLSRWLVQRAARVEIDQSLNQ